MNFCESITELVMMVEAYQRIFQVKPVLYEKNKCVVAAHGPEIKISGDVFALPFHCIEADAKGKGIDISAWK